MNPFCLNISLSTSEMPKNNGLMKEIAGERAIKANIKNNGCQILLTLPDWSALISKMEVILLAKNSSILFSPHSLIIALMEKCITVFIH